MRSSISLGKIFGISVGVSYSWFIILVIVSYIVYGQLSLELPRWGTGPLVGLAGATGILFFGSILAHELAHSLVATRSGVPVRGITLFLLGGVSHISREARRPWGEFIIAVVGPLLSLAIGGAMLAVALYAAPALPRGPLRDGLIVVSFLIGWTNLALGVFNLLPGYPLDGGRVLRAGIWGITGNYWLSTTIAIFLGQALAVVMSLASVAFFLRTGNLLHLWPILVGAFIFLAASSAKSTARDRRQLRGVSAGEVVSTEAVHGTLTIAEAVNLHLLRSGRNAVLVELEGVKVGLLGLRTVRRLPRDIWGVATTFQAMTPLSSLPAIDAASDAWDAMEALEEDEALPAVVVTRDGLAEGVITRGDLFAYMQVRRALDMAS